MRLGLGGGWRKRSKKAPIGEQKLTSLTPDEHGNSAAALRVGIVGVHFRPVLLVVIDKKFSDALWLRRC